VASEIASTTVGGRRASIAVAAHATAGDEIFYPAARKAIDEPDLIDEADVEPASAEALIAQIEESSPSDDHGDAKVKVFGEYIDHHVQEEEGEMFPKVRRAKVDTVAPGEQIAERPAQIMQKKVWPNTQRVGHLRRRHVSAAALFQHM
jgi:hypothetical protein